MTAIFPPHSPTEEGFDEVDYEDGLDCEGQEEDEDNLSLGDLAWFSLLSRVNLHDAFSKQSTFILEFCPTTLEWIPESQASGGPIYRVSVSGDGDVCGAIMEHIIGEKMYVVAQMGVKRTHLGDPSVEYSWVQENMDGGVLGFRGLLQSMIWDGKWVALERCEDASVNPTRRYWKATSSAAGQEVRLT